MPLAQSDSQIASSSSNTELGRRVRILSHGSIERSEQEESMLGKHRRTEEKDVKSDLESDSHNVKKSRESSSSFFIQDATPPGFQVGSLSNIRPTATPNVSKSASRENSPKR